MSDEVCGPHSRAGAAGELLGCSASALPASGGYQARGVRLQRTFPEGPRRDLGRLPKVTQWPSSLRCLEANDFRSARHNLCPKSATRSQGVLAPPPRSFSPVFRSLTPPLPLPLVTIQTQASDASFRSEPPREKNDAWDLLETTVGGTKCQQEKTNQAQ